MPGSKKKTVEATFNGNSHLGLLIPGAVKEGVAEGPILVAEAVPVQNLKTSLVNGDISFTREAHTYKDDIIMWRRLYDTTWPCASGKRRAKRAVALGAAITIVAQPPCATG